MKTIYDPSYIRLVEQIKARRQALGVDQRTVAARLGHTNRWLSKVEHLDVRLDVMTYIRVCRALGLSAHRLIKEVEESLEEDAPPLSCQSVMSGWNLCFRESCGVPVGFTICPESFSGWPLFDVNCPTHETHPLDVVPLMIAMRQRVT